MLRVGESDGWRRARVLCVAQKWLDDLIAVITRTPLPRALVHYKVASSLVLTTTNNSTFPPSTPNALHPATTRVVRLRRPRRSNRRHHRHPLLRSRRRYAHFSLSFLSLYSPFLYETRTGITLSASMLAVPPLFPAASAASTPFPANENLLARQWARLYNTGKMVAPPLAATSALSLFYAAYAHWYV